MSWSTFLQDGTTIIRKFRCQNAINDYQQIDHIAFRHSTYLNVLQHENRIPEYQQNDLIPEQHYPYLNVSKPENAILGNQQIDHITKRNQHICERFQASKHDSWV